MTIVYATGGPRSFEFAVAHDRRKVPEGAAVMAVCDGPSTTKLLDDDTFERMSDEEYYELQGVIADAGRDERARAGAGGEGGPLGEFWRALPRCRACEWLHAPGR